MLPKTNIIKLRPRRVENASAEQNENSRRLMTYKVAKKRRILRG
jgi:hypothetical protein